MVDDLAKYTFKIDGFTPENMPFGRLVEYYAEIKKLLGVSDDMHLVEIVEGSHASQFRIDQRSQKAVAERVYKVRNGTAPGPAMRARDNIDAMLKDDGTSGSFADSGNDNVIQFAGNAKDSAVLVRVRDNADFVGELYHIAGTASDVKARIQTADYNVVFCTTTRELGKSLRDFLFENVKVSGRGLWAREADGEWGIEDFTITDFAPVKGEGLRDAVDRIRDLNVDWPDDVIGEIKEFEEKAG